MKMNEHIYISVVPKRQKGIMNNDKIEYIGLDGGFRVRLQTLTEGPEVLFL